MNRVWVKLPLDFASWREGGIVNVFFLRFDEEVR